MHHSVRGEDAIMRYGVLSDVVYTVHKLKALLHPELPLSSLRVAVCEGAVNHGTP